MRKLAFALALLAGCTPSSPSPQKQAPDPAPAPVAPAATAPAPVVAAERTPLGDPPAPAAESKAELDRSSPAGVVASLKAAVAAKDAAAIARLRTLTGAKPALDQGDLLRARLDFLGDRTRHWQRVFAAIDPTAMKATEGRATLHVAVGGALGSVDLVFVKEGTTWLAAF